MDQYTIVIHLHDNYDVLDYIFMALDLNHIPCMDIFDTEAVTLFMRQHQVQKQLQQVFAEQTQVKAELESITQKLVRIEEEKLVSQ